MERKLEPFSVENYVQRETLLRVREWDPTLESITEVRRFVRTELRDLAQNVQGRIELLASELATNAVIHAMTRYRVVIRRDGGTIRISVIDQASTLPRLYERSDADLSGRGLYVVDTIADDWGVTPLTFGKSVWFQIIAP